jgi:hypothetical protein
VRWNIICQLKEQGGLGILNIDVQNKCLLSKWLFKLINEEGLWQNILKRKYLKTQTITHVQKKPGDSHVWSGLMNVKDSFLNLGHFQLNNGGMFAFRRIVGWVYLASVISLVICYYSTEKCFSLYGL